MKSCRMVFYSDYVSDNQLLSTLKNSSLLDKCYIGFYEKTWEGRPHTKASVDHLKNLVGSSEKVEIVSITQKDIGMKSERFEVETSCRNYILDKAKTDGFRICFIQDADEFLIKEEYKIILDNHVPYMLNQGYDCASIRWVHFWKNWNWVLSLRRISQPNWSSFRFCVQRQKETSNGCRLVWTRLSNTSRRITSMSHLRC